MKPRYKYKQFQEDHELSIKIPQEKPVASIELAPGQSCSSVKKFFDKDISESAGLDNSVYSQNKLRI